MNIEFIKPAEVTIVRMKEKRLDAEIAVEFKKQVVKKMSDNDMYFVFNLSGVEFIDSSGLGAIVTCLKHLNRKGNIYLACLSPKVMPLFELTRMDKVFRMFSSEEEAVKAFG